MLSQSEAKEDATDLAEQLLDGDVDLIGVGDVVSGEDRIQIGQKGPVRTKEKTGSK